MPITPTEVQVVAVAESAKLLFLSLHTATPGATGANEATGGAEHMRQPKSDDDGQ